MSAVRVRVPASTSNLGAGFDCVGVAIDLWLEAEVSLDPTSTRGDDLLSRGFSAACHAAKIVAPRVTFDVTSGIPQTRGLGSSAACIVAGALAANELLHLGFSDERLLNVCGEVEGHADNVAPCLLGGARLVSRWGTHEGCPYGAREIALHPDICLVFAVPAFELATRRARALLPEFVPHRIAAGAAARAAALVRGLELADPGLLAFALDDVLHVPFRRGLVPGYASVTGAARAAGAFGATLSGSGSSILALTPAHTAAVVGHAMGEAWAGHRIDCRIIQPSIVQEHVCR